MHDLTYAAILAAIWLPSGAAAATHFIPDCARVTNVARNDGRVFIDFSSNGQRAFSAVIQQEDRRAFRDFDLEGLEAHHVRIRGIVQNWRGQPQIALSNPAQIEVLE